MMSTLGPRIGKKKIKRLNGSRRKQKTHSIGNFHVQNADIVQPSRFSAGFLNAPDHFVETEKISLGKHLRELAQKTPIAAAKVDMQWRRPPEDRNQIERREVGCGNQFDHEIKITLAKRDSSSGPLRPATNGIFLHANA